VTGAPAGHVSDGESLLSAYDALICDLDGVVHRGHRAVAGAPEALHRALASGRPVIYATNNASRPPSDVVAHLTGLGAPATVETVVTSAQAGAVRVREMVPSGSAVVALGGPGVVEALAEQGLRPVSPDAAEAAAVLQGYGPTLTVADFAAATRHLLGGVPWVATNGDLTLPVEWGAAPGNGAYVELLRQVVGRGPDAVTGKPAAPLYDLAVARLGVSRERVLAVGDRLDTDIDGAVAAGVDSAWVLTGVHGPSDLLATGRPRPTYVIGSLTELHEAYAAPRRTGDAWVCGPFSATVVTDPVPEVRLVVEVVSNSPEHRGTLLGGERWPIEAVRAGLAALLEARDTERAPAAALARAAALLDGPPC
jgi:HAD superfamily hydrolase (TIGR01450 family)